MKWMFLIFPGKCGKNVMHAAVAAVGVADVVDVVVLVEKGETKMSHAVDVHDG